MLRDKSKFKMAVPQHWKYYWKTGFHITGKDHLKESSFPRIYPESERSLGGFWVPKFGKVFGWFWESEIRKGLLGVLGFRNSEMSLGSFASKNVFLILSELQSSKNLEVEWNQ